MQKRGASIGFGRMRLCAVVFLVLMPRLPSAELQAAPPDPVEELREVLKAPVIDPLERNRAVRERLKTIKSLYDLRRAVALYEWRDADPDEGVAAVDQSNRGAVALAFERAAHDVLQRGNAANRLAVMHMLVRMATTTRGVGTSTSIASSFAAHLADLTRQGDALTREAAARALGQIDPDPALAAPALSRLMESGELSLKVAASDGLFHMMRVVAFLATRNHAANTVDATRTDVVKTAQAVVPAAARGLRDAEPEVRKRCARALAQTAEALVKLAPVARPDEFRDIAEQQRQGEIDRAELLPLCATLTGQVPALTRALSDTDAEVRALARHALEEMASPQVLDLDHSTILRPSRLVVATGAHETGPAGMEGAAQKLAEGMTHEDARSRRTVIDVLESLGAGAAPAAPALVQALSDPDPFVRWAAARTLGKIAPAAAESAVPALVALLKDGDLDLRVAAATALERYGRAARSAAPELIGALPSTDAEMRVAVTHALGAIGAPEGCAAIPMLIDAVADEDARVQQAAIEVLGDFGSGASAAIEPLRKALQARDPKVQKAAGEALLKIMRP